MMKALVVTGSPRKKGNTDILIGQISKGIEEAGGTCDIVRLEGLDIHPCVACGGCEKTGQCVIQDDMQLLYPKIDSADRIVIASPIYFYSVTAQTKAFIDRCQALWSRKYILKQRLRHPVEKIGYLISVSATRGERIFAGAVLTAQYCFDAMDYKYGGEFVVRGADRKGIIAEFEDELVRAELFGKKIIED